jgi:hypothetical protein
MVLLNCWFFAMPYSRMVLLNVGLLLCQFVGLLICWFNVGLLYCWYWFSWCWFASAGLTSFFFFVFCQGRSVV